MTKIVEEEHFGKVYALIAQVQLRILLVFGETFYFIRNTSAFNVGAIMHIILTVETNFLLSSMRVQ